ncbi:MAG: hypothetical protein E5Y73_01965 [Mesorhizobium sp.]|uniref:hypothetical protein n=1 Tax=Mesorhizobium sp. TaxID=1871066 RepID=UPI0011FB2847|nr:hypothetical protein [Mesorhizobium sp.]TIL96297.1 MAG: hypothetical protein E5Y73_01965 [Mesorhizobium sp.]
MNSMAWGWPINGANAWVLVTGLLLQALDVGLNAREHVSRKLRSNRIPTAFDDIPYSLDRLVGHPTGGTSFGPPRERSYCC